MILKNFKHFCLLGLLTATAFLTAQETLKPDLDIESMIRARLGNRLKNEFVLFEADVSAKRIIEDDRSTLDLGTADFVTAFNGNDFFAFNTEIPISKRKTVPALEIVPGNGSSFTTTNPPLEGPTIGGVFDHVKFLAYSIFAEAPVKDGVLTSTWIGSGRQINVDAQPYNAVYPSAVINPHDDPRLACFGFVSLDPALLLTADWICTDNIIYALYERLPGAEGLFGDYAAFTYMIPVHYRKAGTDPLTDYHQFQTIYDREHGTITWALDGKNVFQVNQIGHRLDSKNGYVYSHRRQRKKHIENPDFYKVNDHGGINVLIDPVGFESGLSLFTLLDFYLPNNVRGVNSVGLVRLESSLYRASGINHFFYNNPIYPNIPAQFVFNSTLNGSFYDSTIPRSARLWGQGAALRLLSYTVSVGR